MKKNPVSNPEFIHNIAIYYSLEMTSITEKVIQPAQVSSFFKSAKKYIDEALEKLPQNSKYLQTKSMILLE